ncbi:hypothetical protein WJX75_002893 [Coccomyxa subellipsoidea]|uniref:Uncharacterized protein n=1 Tax=Coccomyxa subellipsoidea TaxID=248742 RepID=A0ABR2Z004_9CHLO
MLIKWVKEGHKVLWHNANDEFLFFEGDTVSEVLRYGSILRYIVDGAKPFSAGLSVAQSIVVHDPSPHRYKDYMKVQGAANRPLFMPFWDIAELDAVREKLHPHISHMDMIQLVARVGHVPAALNEGQPERMKASLAETAWNLSWQDIVGAKPGTARCSHRIAKIHPPNWQNGDFADHQLEFLSATAEQAVVSNLLTSMSADELEDLANSTNEGLAADLDGDRIFKLMVHDALKSGGTWQMRLLPSEDDVEPDTDSGSTKAKESTAAGSILRVPPPASTGTSAPRLLRSLARPVLPLFKGFKPSTTSLARGTLFG